MPKLLINPPSGAQEIVEVDASGGYFDTTRVLWDERTDGPILTITLGGMKRVGNVLEYDASLYAIYSESYLTAHKIRKRQVINAEANRRITKHYGVIDGKQANMLKRGLELTRKRAMLVVLTPAETSEENVLLQAMQYIDDVREAGRIAKQAVIAATNVAEVDAVTVNWPAGTPPDWPL